MSLRGQVIYLLLVPQVNLSDLKTSRSNSGLISRNSRNKPKSHEPAPNLVPILEHNFIGFFHGKSPWVVVAQSANPSTIRVLL